MLCLWKPLSSKTRPAISKEWLSYVTSTGRVHRSEEHIKFDKEHAWEQQSSMKGSQQAISCMQYHVNKTCLITWTFYLAPAAIISGSHLLAGYLWRQAKVYCTMFLHVLFQKVAIPIAIKAHTTKFLSTLPSTNTTAPSLWPTISHSTLLNSLSLSH